MIIAIKYKFIACLVNHMSVNKIQFERIQFDLLRLLNDEFLQIPAFSIQLKMCIEKPVIGLFRFLNNQLVTTNSCYIISKEVNQNLISLYVPYNNCF